MDIGTKNGWDVSRPDIKPLHAVDEKEMNRSIGQVFLFRIERQNIHSPIKKCTWYILKKEKLPIKRKKHVIYCICVPNGNTTIEPIELNAVQKFYLSLVAFFGYNFSISFENCFFFWLKIQKTFQWFTTHSKSRTRKNNWINIKWKRNIRNVLLIVWNAYRTK